MDVLDRTRLYACAGGLIIAMLMISIPVRAEPPRFWDPGFRVEAPDLSGLERLRFLTSLDFPPFNFADANKKPTGFNVDLARAVCDVLDVAARCEIQAMPWDELEPALEARRGEVILAGTAPSSEKRAQFGLSEPYFKLPARFVAKRGSELVTADWPGVLQGRTVAVVENTAHQAMLDAYFSEADAMPVANLSIAYAALKDGSADLIFGDGVTLSFWLAAPASDTCCTFVSGPYLSDAHLGLGMVAVTRRDDRLLLDAINAALKTVEDSGAFGEIYARYFPIDPFGS